LSRVAAFGPKGNGPNILLLDRNVSVDIWQNLVPSNEESTYGVSTNSDRMCSIRLEEEGDMFKRVWSRIQSAIAAGFQTVTGGYLFLIFLYLCLYGCSIWKHMV
jgi:hypothetical protein